MQIYERKHMRKTILTITTIAVAGFGMPATSRAGDGEWATAGKVLAGLFAAKVIHDVARRPVVRRTSSTVCTTTPTVYQTPVVYRQPVVYQQQQPVVYHQQPVVYQQQQPVVYQQAPRQVIQAQPTVVYQQPAVVYQQPVYVAPPAVIYTTTCAPTTTYYTSRPSFTRLGFGSSFGHRSHRSHHRGHGHHRSSGFSLFFR